MIQVIFLGIITILGLYGLSKIDKISGKGLIIFSVIIVIISILFIFSESQNDSYQKEANRLNLDFGQGKNIICRDFNVSNQNFNITSNSFVAKKDSRYIGTIIPFQNCFQN